MLNNRLSISFFCLCFCFPGVDRLRPVSRHNRHLCCIVMFEATLLITKCINTIERHAAGESDLMRRRSAVESVSGCVGPRRRLQVYKLSDRGISRSEPKFRVPHTCLQLGHGCYYDYRWATGLAVLVQAVLPRHRLSPAHRRNAMPSTAYVDNDRLQPTGQRWMIR